jgi:hypothetical protein
VREKRRNVKLSLEWYDDCSSSDAVSRLVSLSEDWLGYIRFFFEAALPREEHISLDKLENVCDDPVLKLYRGAVIVASKQGTQCDGA